MDKSLAARVFFYGSRCRPVLHRASFNVIIDYNNRKRNVREMNTVFSLAECMQSIITYLHITSFDEQNKRTESD